MDGLEVKRKIDREEEKRGEGLTIDGFVGMVEGDLDRVLVFHVEIDCNRRRGENETVSPQNALSFRPFVLGERQREKEREGKQTEPEAEGPFVLAMVTVREADEKELELV